IDVLEHVLEDLDFVENLQRVAQHQILLTTPNYTASRCNWPYHIREYMPHQLVDLFSKKGTVTLYKGTSNGIHIYPVKYQGTYFLFNKLRVHPATSFLARCWNYVIPQSMQILSHLFIRVELD
ncbi:MAG: hypothetical protein DRR42_27265, partial [Gammaproteobacteria bacterium]